MRFASLGSGSRGNATVVQANGTCVLVDCGISLKRLEWHLSRLGLDGGDIAAVLVTHEHGDHVSGVGNFARKYAVPAITSFGTGRAAEAVLGPLGSQQLISAQDAFQVGDFHVQALPVPHDALEPCQYLFDDGRHRFALVTDLGRVTSFLCERLSGLDALMLEFNHDPGLLAESSYPPAVKRRIGSPLGHLSNDDAAQLLGRLDTARLQHFVAAHLSEANNRPELVRGAAAQALGCEADWIVLADQDAGTDWLTIG